jgi:hypothetical protein
MSHGVKQIYPPYYWVFKVESRWDLDFLTWKLNKSQICKHPKIFSIINLNYSVCYI